MARATIRCLTDLYLAVSDNKLHCPKTIYFEQSLFLIKRFHNVGKELTSHPGFTISEIRKWQSFDNFEAAWFCQLTNNYSLLFTAVHVCELKHSESVYGNFCPIWLFIVGKSQRSSRHVFVERFHFITVQNIFGILSTKKLQQNICHPFVDGTVIYWHWFAVKFFWTKRYWPASSAWASHCLVQNQLPRFTASCDAFGRVTWSVTVAPWVHVYVNHCVSASLTSLCTDCHLCLRLVFLFICMQDLRSSFLRIFAAVE